MYVFHNLPLALTHASEVFLVVLDWDSDNCPLTTGFLPRSAFTGLFITSPALVTKNGCDPITSAEP